MSEGVYIGELNHSKKKQRRNWGWGILGAVVLIILLGGLTLIVKAPFFHIEKVEISGTSQISEDNVLAIIYSRVASDSWWDRVLGQSHMLAWPKAFQAEDLGFAPVIKGMAIEKNYSERVVLVTVNERTAEGIWCLEKTEPVACYWFDNEGVLFKPAFSSEGNLIRVVRDYAHTSLGVGHSVLVKGLLPNLFAVLKVLEDSDMSVKEVGLYNLSLEEIEVATFGGPRILFSLRFSPEGAAEVIESLRSKKSFNSLNYIDFRVEHRAYYK